MATRSRSVASRPLIVLVSAWFVAIALVAGIATPASAATPVTVTGTVALGTSGNAAPAGAVAINYQRQVSGVWSVETSGAVTTTGGAYSLTLPDRGTYRLHFVYLGGDAYLGEYYDNVVFPGNAANIFNSDRALNATVLEAPVTASGTVLLEGGTAAGDGVTRVTVWTYNVTTRVDIGSDLTDADGHWSIPGVRPGMYYFDVDYLPGSQYFDSMAVWSTAAAGKSFTLGRSNALTGRVSLDGRFAGAGEVSAKIYRDGNSHLPIQTVTTDGSGDYRFSALPSYATYSVEFSVPGGGYEPLRLQNVAVQAQDVVRDVALAAYARIAGHVTGPSGQALAGIQVRADRYDEAGNWASSSQTATDAGGDYAFLQLTSGWYEISFVDPSGLYASVGWDGYSNYYIPDAIELASGDDVEGIDAALPLAGIIRGTVSGTGLTASNLPSVALEVYVYDGSVEDWVATGDVFHPDSTGAYLVPTIFPDDYRLSIQATTPSGYVGMLSPVLNVTAGATRLYNPMLTAVRPPAGQLVKFPDGATVYVTDGQGGLIVLPSFDTARDFGLATSVRVVEHGSIAITSIYGPLTPVVHCGTAMTPTPIRVGAGGALVQVSDTDVLGLPYTTVPSSLCAVLPNGDMDLPLFVRTANDPTVWVIDSGKRDRVPDAALFPALRALYGQPPVKPVRIVSQAFLAAIPVGGVAMPYGRLVKTTDSPTVYLVDDERLLPLSSFAPVTAGGISPVIFSYAPGSFAGTEIATETLGHIVQCAGTYYVAGGGRWTAVAQEAVDGMDVTVLDGSQTCMWWPRTYTHLAPSALFAKTASDPTIYLLDGGVRRPVFSMNTIQRLTAPGAPTWITVEPSFLESYTVGTGLLEPGMLVKASGPTVYLVDGEGTGLVPVPSFTVISDMGIPAAFATVPDAALAGIPVGAPLTNVITCLGGTWLAASGRLWPVQSSVVTGLPVTALADSTCQQLPRSSAAAAAQVAVKGSDATISVLAGGTKRAALAIGTVQRATSAGFPLYLGVGDAFLASIPTGPALIDPSMLVKGTGATVYLADGSGPTLRPVPSAALLADYGLPLAFVTVSDATVSGLTAGSELTHVVTCLSTTWVAASGTLWPVQASAVSGLPSTTLADATCLQLRRSSAAAADRLFLRQSNGTIFSLEGGQKRPVLTMATVQRLAPAGMPSYLGVADSFLASAPTGTAILEAGMLVKGAGATIYLVDGLGGKVPVPSFEAVADFGLSTAFVTVADATIAGLTTRASLSNFVDCGGSARLAGAGRLWAMTAGDRGSATPTSLSTALCGALPSGTFSLASALLVKAPTVPTVYRIVNGQKTAIDAVTFAALGGRYVVVNAGFLAGVPST